MIHILYVYKRITYLYKILLSQNLKHILVKSKHLHII